VNAIKASILVVSTAMLIAMPASQAVATPAQGTNPFLPANGEVYIPLKPSTSGTLGVGNTGLVPDSLTIAGINTSTGFLMFDLLFDLSGEVLPPVITNGTLFLTFRDLDFVPIFGAGNRYSVGERLDVQFDGNAPLAMTQANYTNFGGAPPTNNNTQTYDIDLRTELGVTDAQFAQMRALEQFTVNLTLYTDVHHLVSRPDTLNNTAETIFANDFTFVPEPATMVLIVTGAVGIVLHRRRGAGA